MKNNNGTQTKLAELKAELSEMVSMASLEEKVDAIAETLNKVIQQNKQQTEFLNIIRADYSTYDNDGCDDCRANPDECGGVNSICTDFLPRQNATMANKIEGIIHFLSETLGCYKIDSIGHYAENAGRLSHDACEQLGLLVTKKHIPYEGMPDGHIGKLKVEWNKDSLAKLLAPFWARFLALEEKVNELHALWTDDKQAIEHNGPPKISDMPKQKAAAGQWLKMIRVQYGLSQQGVADAIGLTQGVLSHIETGTRKPRKRELESFFRMINQRDSKRRFANGQQTGEQS